MENKIFIRQKIGTGTPVQVRYGKPCKKQVPLFWTICL